MKIIILAITFAFSLLVYSKAQEEPALEENYMRFEAEISAFRLQGKEGLGDLGRSLGDILGSILAPMLSLKISVATS